MLNVKKLKIKMNSLIQLFMHNNLSGYQLEIKNKFLKILNLFMMI